MAKKSMDPDRSPGNDGSWYLDLLGVDPNSVSADPSLKTTVNTNPGLAGSNVAPNQLETRDLARQKRARRSRRWKVGISLVGSMIMLGGLALWWIPKLAEQRVTERLHIVRMAVAEVRRSLPATQNSLAIATEPESDDTALAAIKASLDNAIAAADQLTKEGVAPLPGSPPLIGSSVLDAIASEQDRFSFMGAEAHAIALRIATTVDYRNTLAKMFVVPDLPTSTTAEELDTLNATLVASFADSVAAAAALPADAALAEHADAVLAALDRFGEWQVEYIDLLRREAQTGAHDLIVEFTIMTDALKTQLISALSVMRTELDIGILELVSQLDRTLVALPS